MAARPTARPTRLSRDSIVNAALTFLDREGWDALTINALAIQLGTKGPSLYNHVDSLDDLRRTVRMRVVDDIIEMLNTVGQGRTRDDAVMAMASAYRSYAHHHPGRYSAFTRMPLGRRRPRVHRGHPRRRRAGHLGAGLLRARRRGRVLRRAGVLVGDARFRAAGDDRRDGPAIDTDAVFTDMVMRLAAGMEQPVSVRLITVVALTCGTLRRALSAGLERRGRPGIVDDRAWQIRRLRSGSQHACTPGQFACPADALGNIVSGAGACDTPGRGVTRAGQNCSTET